MARLMHLAEQHKVSSDHLIEFWSERAAIREYDGAMTRRDAELGAMDDVATWLKLWDRLGRAQGKK